MDHSQTFWTHELLDALHNDVWQRLRPALAQVQSPAAALAVLLGDEQCTVVHEASTRAAHRCLLELLRFAQRHGVLARVLSVKNAAGETPVQSCLNAHTHPDFKWKKERKADVQTALCTLLLFYNDSALLPFPPPSRKWDVDANSSVSSDEDDEGDAMDGAWVLRHVCQLVLPNALELILSGSISPPVVGAHGSSNDDEVDQHRDYDLYRNVCEWWKEKNHLDIPLAWMSQLKASTKSTTAASSASSSSSSLGSSSSTAFLSVTSTTTPRISRYVPFLKRGRSRPQLWIPWRRRAQADDEGLGSRRERLVRLLVAHGADLEAREEGRWGETCALAAARAKDAAGLRLLAELKADVLYVRDGYGNTPAHVACDFTACDGNLDDDGDALVFLLYHGRCEINVSEGQETWNGNGRSVKEHFLRCHGGTTLYQFAKASTSSARPSEAAVRAVEAINEKGRAQWERALRRARGLCYREVLATLLQLVEDEA